jgi:hypothetical protein
VGLVELPFFNGVCSAESTVFKSPQLSGITLAVIVQNEEKKDKMTNETKK